jgi:asparagine synthase (glutamine-hydrolysing)
MPGISIVYKKNNENLNDYQAILNSLNHLKYYNSRIFLNNNKCFAGFNGYDSYPLVKMKICGYDVILEGRIYNRTKNEIEIQLGDILSINKLNHFYDRLSTWILESDGEFVIYLISDESLLIFNDIFGRMPLYYFEDENRVIVSRFLNFIVKSISKKMMDSIGISIYLLLGYMLGERTLLKNVKQLRPVTLLKYSSNRFELIPLFSFNLETKNNVHKNDKDIICDLKDLFSISCKYRYQTNEENIITLSGGLDSRLVASAMVSNQIPFKAATMVYKNGYAREEIAIAEELCRIYGSKLDKTLVMPPTGSDVLELLKLKEGMNSLSTAPIIPFYHKLLSTFSKGFVYITGDNGDKIIFTLDRPPINFNTLDDLVNFIITDNSIMPIEYITQITGITREEIFEEIKTNLLNFPEKDYFQKYVHFRSIEKPFKYAFQGEDRHRSYFWNSSPFWSYGFFNYFMNCSDFSKRKHRIFAGLLNSYSREATDLPYANFHSSVNSIKGKIFMNLVYNIYHLIPVADKKILKNYFFGGNPKVNENFQLYQLIKEQTEESDEIDCYIKIDKIMEFDLNRSSAYNIFTLTSAIEYLLSNKSILYKYYENELP